MITAEQYDALMKPIRAGRVSTRRQGGKELSYVEAWDIKAHLSRMFGIGNWDCEMLEYHHIGDRAYIKDGKDMVEVVFSARMRLTIRDPHGDLLCCHSEGAVGNASGPVSQWGELLDNALKTAASDGLKRCAINMGSQFGLSLYKSGSLGEVIRSTVVVPEGWTKPEVTEEQAGKLNQSLGAQADA